MSGVFLPCGQVGVGIQGGLEGTVHSIHHVLSLHADDPRFGLLKVDMWNALMSVVVPPFLIAFHMTFQQLLIALIGVVVNQLSCVLVTVGS